MKTLIFILIVAAVVYILVSLSQPYNEANLFYSLGKGVQYINDHLFWWYKK